MTCVVFSVVFSVMDGWWFKMTEEMSINVVVKGATELSYWQNYVQRFMDGLK